MKTYRFFLMYLGLLLCLCLFSSPASAIKAVDTPKASSDAVFTNEPTTITVTAQVSVDPALLVSNVNLVSVNSLGQITGIVARMYDDGTHGDALPGDGTFTAQITFNPSQSGNENFAVTVAYKGTLKRVQSRMLVIAIVNRPSDADINIALSVPIAGTNYFNSQKVLVGEQKARTNLIAFLLHQPGVARASLGPDGFTVGITFTSGLQSVIFTSPDGTAGNSGYVPKVFSHPRELKPLSHSYLVPTAPRQTSSFLGDTSSVDFTGNAKGIVLAPFNDAFTQVTGINGASSVADSLSKDCGGQPLFLPNGDADVNAFGLLRAYGVIYIETHGGVFPDGSVVLSTGEQVTLLNRAYHLIDWVRGRLLADSNPSYPNTDFWCVTPSFFEATAGGGYPKSLVCLSACDGVANNSLWNVFQRHGVKTVFGFDNTVSIAFLNPTGISLFKILSDPSKAAQDRTAQVAYDSLATTIDPAVYNGKHAVFQIKGDTDLALIADPVINGDFETGDFTGWVTDTAPGYDKVALLEDLDGQYSARIGRWDQPYMPGGGLRGPPIQGAEPGGQDYIYQDVDLPDGVSSLTLNFDYDVQSYDGADYDWFDATVLDATTGEKLATLVNHVGGIVLGSPANWGLYSTTGRQHITADLTPFKGRRVRLFYGVTQDGYGDQTAAYIDNVSIKCQD